MECTVQADANSTAKENSPMKTRIKEEEDDENQGEKQEDNSW